MSKKYPKFLGHVDCKNVGAIEYWQEVARLNLVEITPIITEDRVMIFAPKDSEIMSWESAPTSEAETTKKGKE